MALRHPSAAAPKPASDLTRASAGGSGKPTIGRADVLAIGEMTVMRQDLGADARHYRTRAEAR
jgi:hypothetical protein